MEAAIHLHVQRRIWQGNEGWAFEGIEVLAKVGIASAECLYAAAAREDKSCNMTQQELKLRFGLFTVTVSNDSLMKDP